MGPGQEIGFDTEGTVQYSALQDRKVAMMLRPLLVDRRGSNRHREREARGFCPGWVLPACDDAPFLSIHEGFTLKSLISLQACGKTH